jgi:hypothetical protein
MLVYGIVIGIVVGLALGGVADYLLLRFGWKPAALFSAAFLACIDAVGWRTSLDALDLVLVALAYAAARLLVEPAVKRHLKQ